MAWCITREDRLSNTAEGEKKEAVVGEKKCELGVESGMALLQQLQIGPMIDPTGSGARQTDSLRQERPPG